MREFLATVIRMILRALRVIAGTIVERWVGPWLTS